MIDRRQALTGAAALFAASAARAQTVAEGVSLATYRSGDADVACVIFTPRREGGPMAGAGVLLLNGGGGANNDVRRFFEDAVGLTDKGYVVVMPNYLGVTPERDAGNRRRWLSVVEDGAAWMSTTYAVDAQRIGGMGFSRGGWLATEAALTGLGLRAAVGVASAGDLQVGQIVRKPPVLLIYADNDPVVDPGRTRSWERRMRDAGVPVETEVLDSDHHVFEPNEWHRIFDAADRFFRRTLTADGAA